MCSPRDPRFAGLNPTEVDGFFSGRKNPEHKSSGRKFKLGVPSLRFQAWGSLTSLKFQTRDHQLKLPPGGLVLRIFTSWKKSIYLSRVSTREPWIFEASTVPRDHRGRNQMVSNLTNHTDNIQVIRVELLAALNSWFFSGNCLTLPLQMSFVWHFVCRFVEHFLLYLFLHIFPLSAASAIRIRSSSFNLSWRVKLIN